jgi:hypothetical protein
MIRYRPESRPGMAKAPKPFGSSSSALSCGQGSARAMVAVEIVGRLSALLGDGVGVYPNRLRSVVSSLSFAMAAAGLGLLMLAGGLGPSTTVHRCELIAMLIDFPALALYLRHVPIGVPECLPQTTISSCAAGRTTCASRYRSIYGSLPVVGGSLSRH